MSYWTKFSHVGSPIKLSELKRFAVKNNCEIHFTFFDNITNCNRILSSNEELPIGVPIDMYVCFKWPNNSKSLQILKKSKTRQN